MKHKHTVLLGITTLFSAFQLSAETVQHTVVVPSTTLLYLSGSQTPIPVSVPQFDGSLGSLVSVQVSTKATMNYNSMVMNFGPSANAGASYAVNGNLLRPDASSILDTSVSVNEQAFIASFENAIFFGSAESTQQTTLTGAGDLSLFTGAGSVALTLSGGGSVFLSDPFNLFDFTDLQLAAEIVVTYEYAVTSSTQEVVVDVQPNLNLKSNGVVPVSVLSTSEFSAVEIDPSSLLLGDPALTGAVAPLRSAVEDVNGDGLPDLVLHFSMPALVSAGAVNAATTELALTGSTPDGGTIAGSDTVRIVPGSSKGK